MLPFAPSFSSSILSVRTAGLTVVFFPSLQVDATSTANSGHPGAPMGMAPISHVLFNKYAIRAGHGFNPAMSFTDARIGNQVHEVQPQKPQVGQPRPICPLVSLVFFFKRKKLIAQFTLSMGELLNPCHLGCFFAVTRSDFNFFSLYRFTSGYTTACVIEEDGLTSWFSRPQQRSWVHAAICTASSAWLRSHPR